MTTHEELTTDELDAIVESTLADAGTDLDALRDQADSGVYDCEAHRRAWFVIAGLGRT